MSSQQEQKQQQFQALRQSLLSEIEASQQAIAELSEEELTEIVGGMNQHPQPTSPKHGTDNSLQDHNGIQDNNALVALHIVKQWKREKIIGAPGEQVWRIFKDWKATQARE